jgi:asparagine synthase (glutamine-hydrolysing)
MCGVTGIVSFNATHRVDEPTLVGMRDALTHRGPDGAGIHIEGNVGFAHRRLSVIDIEGGHQPMLGADGQVWLTYNGEIYNFHELRKELESLGCSFKTHSDTEVVLNSYLQWGTEAIKRFNGMFAMAIWDARKQILILWRDRLGIKPLYWTKVDGTILFSSEVKSFRLYDGFTVEADLDAISSYLTFRQAVWDLCFFKDVHKVLPGHIVVFSASGVSNKPYWNLPLASHTVVLSEREWQEQTERLLSEAVRKRMIADVPIGSYLSGGLDSSLIVAMMSRQSKNPINTFSIGYEADEYDEGPYAECVADEFSTNHHHIVLGQEDYLSVWTRLIRQRDIPLSIPHEIPLFRLSQEIKKNVTVALSGEGADELFGGYGRVQRSPMDWKKAVVMRRILGGDLASKISRLPQLSGTGFDSGGCASHLEHFFSVYNWVPFDEKNKLLTPDAVERLNGDETTIRVFKNIFNTHADANPYDTVLHAFQKIHLGCLLDRLDAMSMAASVEARVPFVDHELVEFVVNMPVEYKMRWNSTLSKWRALSHDSFRASEWLDTNKSILRNIGDRLLPRTISRRKKLGFPTPLDTWMGGGMLDMAKDLLLDRTTISRGIFSETGLRALLENTKNLPYDFFGKKVWMLMNVELWFREVMDAGPTPISRRG